MLPRSLWNKASCGLQATYLGVWEAEAFTFFYLPKTQELDQSRLRWGWPGRVPVYHFLHDFVPSVIKPTNVGDGLATLLCYWVPSVAQSLRSGIDSLEETNQFRNWACQPHGHSPLQYQQATDRLCATEIYLRSRQHS